MATSTISFSDFSQEIFQNEIMRFCDDRTLCNLSRTNKANYQQVVEFEQNRINRFVGNLLEQISKHKLVEPALLREESKQPFFHSLTEAQNQQNRIVQMLNTLAPLNHEILLQLQRLDPPHIISQKVNRAILIRKQQTTLRGNQLQSLIWREQWDQIPIELIKGEDLEPGCRANAVYRAVEAGRLDIAWFLLPPGAPSNKAFGWAIYYVTTTSLQEIVPFLLQDAEPHISVEAALGWAVYYAANAGPLESVQFLLQHGHISDKDRNRAITAADRAGRADIAQFLRQDA